MVDRRVALINDPDASNGPALDAGVGPPGAAITGRFTKLGVGQPLPSDADCAARVRRSSWEPRPQNAGSNAVNPTAVELGQLTPWDGRVGYDAKAVALGKRVTGAFAGTTDEILQWGACKWGFDEDFVRAYAQQASEWNQGKIASWTDNAAVCPADGATRTAFGVIECAQVYGIFQLMWRYSKSTWPMSRDSTPFNVDYSLGVRRACFEGYLPWLKDSAPSSQPYVPGDEFGCLGADATGYWYDNQAVNYMNGVKEKLEAKSWNNAGF